MTAAEIAGPSCCVQAVCVFNFGLVSEGYEAEREVIRKAIAHCTVC